MPHCLSIEETAYVHGYAPREAERLRDQADTLSQLLHHDTHYAAGERVLECGCGVGAQTVYLAAQSPDAQFTSVDISPESVESARTRAASAGLANVRFGVANLFDLPFDTAEYDHAFLCFVLEHLANPVAALRAISRVVKPGGTITVIEGDHGSWYCSPETADARRVVECLVEAQAWLGGDALIGRRLYPLLVEAGLDNVRVSPRMVYVDASRPDLVEGFSKNTFITMVEGAREQALERGLIDETRWTRGIRDLYRATEPDATFCYTFFKAVAHV